MFRFLFQSVIIRCRKQVITDSPCVTDFDPTMEDRNDNIKNKNKIILKTQ